MTPRKTEDEVTRPITTPKREPSSSVNMEPEETFSAPKRARKGGFKWTWILTLSLVLCAIVCLIYMSFFQKDELLSEENNMENAQSTIAPANTSQLGESDPDSFDDVVVTEEESIPDSLQDEEEEIGEPEELNREPEQEPEVVLPDNHIYDMSETQQNPTFPGGDGAMYNWLKSNNSLASDDSANGKVIVSFVVEKNGSITDVRVVRGRGAKLDAEAVRLVNAMPSWTPGYNNGQPVRVKYQLPITF